MRPKPTVAVLGAGAGGHRDGRPAQAGRLRVHHLREVRRRRRHVARQHLSGRRVRRAVAPLLVLVRAEPVVEPHLRDPARDPRLPRALHRPVRRPPARAHRHRDRRGALGGRPRSSGGSTARVRRGVHRRGPGERARHAERPARSRDPRRRAVPRSCRSTRRSGTTASPLAGERVASIGTGASAIQYVPAIAPEVEHLTVFQRTPIWITPRLDEPFTTGAAATVRPRAAVRPAGTAGRSGGPTSGPLPGSTRSRRRCRPSWRGRTSTARSRTPSCGRSSPPTIRSAASDR